MKLPLGVAFVLASSLVACSGSNKGTGGSSSSGSGSSGGGSGSSSGTSGSSSGTSGSSSGTSGSSSGTTGGGPGCTVASMGTSGTLLSGTVLLPTGPTTGELLIDATGKIACAAADCSSTSGYSDATHVACPSSVISPGMINAHDHTEYATTAPQNLGTTRYECRNEWRTGANGATATPHVSSTTDAATIAAQELRFVMSGATSVVGSGGVGGLMRNLADYSAQADLEGLTGKTVYFDTFPLGDSNGTVLASGCGYPKVVSTSTAFQDGQFAPHISEGINADAENEFTCLQAASVITTQTSIIHGVGLNATDIATVKTDNAKLVWAPRSNIDLYGDTARVTTYDFEGVTIALGTDWLASGSMNMLRELNCADTLNQKYMASHFTDQQLWQMATINAAVAAGFDSQIGSLETGKVADVAVFDASVNQGYRAVIAAGNEDVQLVLRGGKVLYGDASLVDSIQTGCTAMDVCGVSRDVCIEASTTVALSAIQAIGTSVYPLFFCKGSAPTGEPSCTPYRTDYANGITATDQDGDGVADATDICPTIFDPARPMDNGKQSDVDGDGFGDACDAQPTNASAH